MTNKDNYSLIKIPIDEKFLCLKSLSKTKVRFEIEYSLGKGTTCNSFLLFDENQSNDNNSATLIHPPGNTFLEVFLPYLKNLLPSNKTKLNIIIGHVNPNRIKVLKAIAYEYLNLTFICSNPASKLISELWNQQNKNNQTQKLPDLKVIKTETVISIGKQYSLRLFPSPTARWPGALIAFEEKTRILMSDKLFGAHICSENWSESNRASTEDERRHYFDCLMTQMTNQVNNIIEKIEYLDISTIAPCHGPAIESSWRSLLNDYIRWGENNTQTSLNVLLIFASAYGNTAAIADTLSKGISATGIKVSSINCEFISPQELVHAIHKADAYLIGSPTLGGHAPTPIVSALGALLAEGDKQKQVGIFGSYGWSGEALDLLEKKLRDGGFEFGFQPIKIKFSPDSELIKKIEEIGTSFGRKLIKNHQKSQNSGGINATKTDPALLALGKIVGSLSILTAKNNDNCSSAMVASWISQASFSPPGFTVAVAKDRAVEKLLHTESLFALNILGESNYQQSLKQFLKPFAPGEDRFSAIKSIKFSPGDQPILPEALAWLEAKVLQRMECGDHWLIYAEVLNGKVQNPRELTAIHHRRNGANY